MGGCSSTLLFVLSNVFLNLFIVVLCDLLISLIIDVGISINSVVDFGISGVACPFVLIIIGILVF